MRENEFEKIGDAINKATEQSERYNCPVFVLQTDTRYEPQTVVNETQAVLPKTDVFAHIPQPHFVVTTSLFQQHTVEGMKVACIIIPGNVPTRLWGVSFSDEDL